MTDDQQKSQWGRVSGQVYIGATEDKPADPPKPPTSGATLVPVSPFTKKK